MNQSPAAVSFIVSENNRFNNLILSIRVMMKVYILAQSRRIFTHFYFLLIQSYGFVLRSASAHRFWYEQKFSRRVWENVCMCLIEKNKRYSIVYNTTLYIRFQLLFISSHLYRCIYTFCLAATPKHSNTAGKKWKLGVCDCVCICECVYYTYTQHRL